MKQTHVVGLLIALAFLFFLLCRQIIDVDMFWQIRSGQLMLESGRLIRHDPFTYTHQGEPVPVVYWLSQGIFALAYRWGGWPAVQITSASLLAGAYAVAGLSGRDRQATPFGMGLAMVLGFLAGFSNGEVRPQCFALCGLAIVLALVRSRLSLGAKLAGALPVMLVWQNAHPSLSLALVALTALTVGGWVEHGRDPARPRPWDATLLLAAAALVLCATPLGAGIFQVMHTNLEVSRDWLEEREWLYPWDHRVAGSVVLFWVTLGLSIVLLARVRSQARPAELALFLAMTVLALSAARFALFWGVAMVPVWARWLDRGRPPSWFAWSDATRWSLSRCVPVMCVAAGLSLGLPPLVRGPILSPVIPMEGLRRLAAELLSGRVYNHREWGGPLILEGRSRWKVAIDGRLFVFHDRDEWRDRADSAAGRVALAEVERRQRPDAFFLEPASEGRLIALLQQSPRWRDLYHDDRCHVFVRLPSSAAPAVSVAGYR
jgi:hypothetical protein